jgi:hypothetical protein
MAYLMLAPPNTICGNEGCNSNVYPDDTEIVRYMGKIYHKRCLSHQVVARMKQQAMREFLNLAEDTNLTTHRGTKYATL